MAVSRFPCRSCGQPTESVDAYIVCVGCLEELEAAAQSDCARPRVEDDFIVTPLAPHEVEARLRKLLDDW